MVQRDDDEDEQVETDEYCLEHIEHYQVIIGIAKEVSIARQYLSAW